MIISNILLQKKDSQQIKIMSKIKHTPGPWIIVPKKASDGSFVNCKILGTDGGNPTCLILNKANDESFANASLIAAAPELLEALDNELVIKTLETFAFRILKNAENSAAAGYISNSRKFMDEYQKRIDFISQIKAVIAKAKGL